MPDEQFIVIVDDDRSIREAATSLVRSMGWVTVAFPSAEEYLGSGYLDKTTCLVLDVQLPGMGGLTLQSRLAAAGRHIPIVFVTGYPDDGVRAQALRSGAVCFLTKPFNEDDLFTGLSSALASENHI